LPDSRRLESQFRWKLERVASGMMDAEKVSQEEGHMRDERISLRRAVVASFLAVTPACAGLQAVEPVAPTSPPAGVEVTVLRQGCTENVDPQWPGADLVDTTVETRVSNRTNDAVTVRRDGFRLVEADGRQLPTSTWGAAEPIVLGVGQTETFRLRFSDRGGLSCSGEMRLDGSAAITKAGTAVPVASVLFRRSRA
jgi:hypothetical protein